MERSLITSCLKEIVTFTNKLLGNDNNNPTNRWIVNIPFYAAPIFCISFHILCCSGKMPNNCFLPSANPHFNAVSFITKHPATIYQGFVYTLQILTTPSNDYMSACIGCKDIPNNIPRIKGIHRNYFYLSAIKFNFRL